jgi:hypothetical protein
MSRELLQAENSPPTKGPLVRGGAATRSALGEVERDERVVDPQLVDPEEGVLLER